MFQLLESCDVKYFSSVVLSEEVLCSETFKQCRDSRVKLKLGKDEGKVEKEEDEEAEKEEEEDEGALQVDCLHCPRVLHPCGLDRKNLKSGRKPQPVTTLQSFTSLATISEEAKMSLAAARPLIGVHSDKNAPTGTTVCLPAVFRAPVRCALAIGLLR